MTGDSALLDVNILIVGGAPADVSRLGESLGAAGCHSIVCTTDPHRVCDLHQDQQFDLILLDLEMAVLDKLQLLDGLQASSGDDYVPIIVLTDEPAEGFEAPQEGPWVFFRRPVEPAELLPHIKNMLEVQRYVRRAQQRLCERLMLSVLPGSAAGRLRAHPGVVAESHPSVTVLVADITGLADPMCPLADADVRALLTTVFSGFDRISAANGLHSMWTAGDPYVATAGFTGPCPDHAERAAVTGLDLIRCLAAIARRKGMRLHARVGLSSGPVAAGTVGSRTFIYDLWGDTVQAAARLEREGVPDRVVVSESTRGLLGPRFHLERRPLPPVAGAAPPSAWFVSRYNAVPDSEA